MELTYPHEQIKHTYIRVIILTETNGKLAVRLLYNEGLKKDPHRTG